MSIAVISRRSESAPRINGKYIGIISQDVAFDLQQNPDYKDLFRYTDNSTFKNGYLFELSGVEFYETSEAKKWINAGAGSIDVYSSLILGKDAFAVTALEGEGLETIVKQLGSSGASDPLNQRATVGWKALCRICLYCFCLSHRLLRL